MKRGDLKEPLLPKNEKEPERKPASILKVFTFAFPIIWGRGGLCIRVMTILAFLFLVLSKVINILGPIALKYAVDTLSISGTPVGAITKEHLATTAG